MIKINLDKILREAERVTGVSELVDPKGWYQFRENCDPDTIIAMAKVVKAARSLIETKEAAEKSLRDNQFLNMNMWIEPLTEALQPFRGGEGRRDV